MIKFFRKIRYQLLGEGKTGKYLKYAIGEILLVVVIGILIALSINNWNGDRMEVRMEKQYYQKLNVNFRADTTSLGSYIDFQTNRMVQIDSCLSYCTINLKKIGTYLLIF